MSVERINISGNTRSQEKILRREIPMAEGDLFTSQKLARARQRLVNLNYFETVNATTAPGATKDKIIVNIDVVEKPTGLFSVGGGYSSQDSFIGTVDLSQRNFLGRGWEVFVRIRGGAQTQQGQIGFTEPWLFDRPLSAGFDLFNNRRIFTEYTVNSLGGDIRFGHPFGEFSRVNLVYRASQDDVSDIAPNASVNLLDQEGTSYTSLIGLSLSRDTRDSVFEPTRGGNSAITFDFAGVGFGQQWFRITSSVSQFFHLPTPWFDGVLGVRVSGGYSLGWAEDPVPLFERFYLGGANSIRSFKAQEISPRDSSGTRIGGNIQALGNIEYTVPLFFGIRVAAFYDVGNVWGPDISAATDFFNSLQIKQAIGLGFRWISPFGPLRVDYGVNPNPKNGESFGNFNFSVGSAF